MAAKGTTNKDILGCLAAIFGGRFWSIPGLTRTFAKEGGTWKLRHDLGTEFKKWSTCWAVMTTNGVSVDLNLNTDTHRSRDWHDNFSQKALRRKLITKFTLLHTYTIPEHPYIKNTN